MYCPSCGAQNDDQARNCSECGQALAGKTTGRPTPPPPNYLVHSILVTLLCCLPLGIPAIIYAAQVDGKYSSGDYEGAARASETAYMWVKIAFFVGLGIIILQLIGVFGFGLGGFLHAGRMPSGMHRMM